MLIRRAATLLLFVVSLSSGFAGTNRWTLHGPSGGTFQDLGWDPIDPRIVLAATDNGVFRSWNGGANWSAAIGIEGTPINKIALSSSNAQRAYASSVYGLFRSDDRGVTWSRVHHFAYTGVAVSRQNADLIYLLNGSVVLPSSDGGATFTAPGTGLPDDQLLDLAVDPQNDQILYVTTASGIVYKSTDGGATWFSATSGITSPMLSAPAIDPLNSSTLYVSGVGGVFKSINAGSSWTKLTLPYAPTTLYYSVSISGNPSIVTTNSSVGTARSSDGVTWTTPAAIQTFALPIAVDPTNPSNMLLGADWTLYRSTDGGVTRSSSASGLNALYTSSIAADPNDPAVVYTAGPRGGFKSSDRGRSWSSIEAFASNVAPDAVNPNVVYALSSGLFRRSIDGGATWQNFATGLTPGSAFMIAVDPIVSGTVYTTSSGSLYKRVGDAPWTKLAALPSGTYAFITSAPKTAGLLFFKANNIVYRSSDGGVSHSPITGLNSGSTTGISVDPFDANHLIASGNTMQESTNGGSSWSANAALPPGMIVFDPATRGVMYSNNVITTMRSIDGGVTWLPFNKGFGRLHGALFAVSSDGLTLYAGGITSGVWTHTIGGRKRPVH